MNRIKELREEKGISLDKLSEDLHINKSTLSRIENGLREPKKSTIEEYANYFDVSTDYLLGRTDVRNSLFINKNEKDYDAENFKTEKELIENMYLDEDMKEVFNIFSELSPDAREKALKVAELFLLDEKNKK
ncbi:TPA: helix-turn-helix transcriptional regulator [Clostridioides difficile]|uniref:XRE family transcriptional regulator n=8 Tax=root TaxID=1 RepID=A0A3G1E3A4_9CAUD|nr:helix-turn-helix transcriptional regulator [Clostridioides difficile]YP_001110765.1 transcriptional regulator [Clostridioides phage phiC2]YP_009206166.1 transcriptional regulator [Clostridium phage phiMMP01]YP_009830840.1 transcriptional regulator [Clostridium phage CDKM9]EQI44148.1 helix-turn-helix family protein [Clostridioides difficile Y184]QVW56758.1 Cro-type transcriptional regulator [Clostridioides phage phiCD418]CCL63974.1 putative repressor [Clostridioides difficile E7]ABE99510.1